MSHKTSIAVLVFNADNASLLFEKSSDWQQNPSEDLMMETTGKAGFTAARGWRILSEKIVAAEKRKMQEPRA